MALSATPFLTSSPLRIHSMIASSSHAALVMVTNSALIRNLPASLSTFPLSLRASP